MRNRERPRVQVDTLQMKTYKERAEQDKRMMNQDASSRRRASLERLTIKHSDQDV